VVPFYIIAAAFIFGQDASLRYNQTIMVALGETISMPLVVNEHGTIRIKGSRVSLDSIIHHFKLGATAEQIVQSFPSLSLGDVYSSIAYYLTHRQEIEEYLQEQETAADALQSNWSLILTTKPRSPNYALVWVDCVAMLRLLIDQDLDHVILRACYFVCRNFDVITAHQAISV
jgi:uncharacterized protein (DUF433 family)